MAVALPFIGAAIGGTFFTAGALGLSGATIGWLAGSNLGTSVPSFTNQLQTVTTPNDDHQRSS